MKKMKNLGRIILAMMFFLIEVYLAIAYYHFLKNDWIFVNHDLFFRGKYSLQIFCFQF